MVGRSLPDEEAMALDADLIKVLAADSRRDILRLLGTRRMTLTELAAALDLKKATVLEHLKRLTDAGLIRRRDDERLWVYYELTPRGNRVVNPGRTRFYLLFALAAAALALGAVAIAVFGAQVEPPEAPPTGAADGIALDVAVEKSTVLPGETFTVRTTLYGGAQAYLLDADDARALREGRAGVEGVPLSPAVPSSPPSAPSDAAGAPGDAPVSPTAAPTSASPTPVDMAYGPSDVTLSFAAPAGLPAGTYYVYVLDATGRSNLPLLAPVVVEPIAVSVEPAVAWRGLTPGVQFKVFSGGEGVSGALELVRGGVGVLRLEAAEGHAALDATRLDALQPGEYGLRVASTGALLDARLTVRDPALALLTPTVAADEPSSAIVAHAPDLDVPVAATLDGAPLESAPAAAPPAALAFALPPLDAGLHELRLGRLVSRTLVAEPPLTLRLSAADDGGNATLRVAGAADAPVAGAAVFFDDALVGATDANGTVALPPAVDGLHEVRVVTSEGHTRRLPALAAAGRLAEAPPRVDVAFEADADADGAVLLQVNVTNALPVDERALVVAYMDGAPRDARFVTLAAHDSTLVAFSLSGVAPGERNASIEVASLRLAGRLAPDASGAPWSPLGDADARGRDLALLVPSPFASPVPEPPASRVVPLPGLPTGAAAHPGEPVAVPGPPAALALVAIALVAVVVRLRRRA